MFGRDSKIVDLNLGQLGYVPALMFPCAALANKSLLELLESPPLIFFLSFAFLVLFYAISFLFPEFRALHRNYRRFRVGTFVVYFGFLIPMVTAKVFFASSNITSTFDVLFVIFLLIYGFLIGRFYQPEYFVRIGWKKSEELEKSDTYLEQNKSRPSSLSALTMLGLIVITVWFIYGFK